MRMRLVCADDQKSGIIPRGEEGEQRTREWKGKGKEIAREKLG
jgi:hypothetical protein